jgi:hypothetical protein
MPHRILLICALLWSYSALCHVHRHEQGPNAPFHQVVMATDTSKKIGTQSKYIVWYMPSQADHVHGVLFHLGLTMDHGSDGELNHGGYVSNGLHLQINPFAFILTPYLLLIPNFGLQEQPTQPSLIQINGINAGINSLGPVHIRGVNLTAGVTLVDRISGLSISGLMNKTSEMRGLSCAVIRNKNHFLRGVQCGIYNSSHDMRGIQIGLWNVNGKRKLPFLNWQFAP